MGSGLIERARLGAGACVLLLGCGLAVAGNSGGFRGPGRNGIYPARGLLKEWPEGGPPLLWKAQLGRGWTAAGVSGDSVFFCGQKGDTRLGVMTALDLEGRVLWRTVYGRDSTRPRGSPVESDGMVYHHTVGGVLHAFDAATGELKWSFDASTLGDTLGQVGGNSASPLVYGKLVIITLRDSGGVGESGKQVPCFVGLDKRTGSLEWRGDLGPCPVPGKGWSNSHASPVLADGDGGALVVGQFHRCAAAVDAATGKKLWLLETVEKGGRRGWRRVRGAVQPVMNEGYAFLFGSEMFRLGEGGTLEKLWKRHVGIKEYNVSYSHSLIADGRLIVFTPGALRLIDARTGEDLASLECEKRGSFVLADAMVYLQDHRPAMTLIEVKKNGLEQVSSFPLPFTVRKRDPGAQPFTHPVVAAGRLFVRYLSSVFVFDLRRTQ